MAITFPSERIERSILFIRGHKVRVDTVLAELYEVPVKVLNQAGLAAADCLFFNWIGLSH